MTGGIQSEYLSKTIFCQRLLNFLKPHCRHSSSPGHSIHVLHHSDPPFNHLLYFPYSPSNCCKLGKTEPSKFGNRWQQGCGISYMPASRNSVTPVTGGTATKPCEWVTHWDPATEPWETETGMDLRLMSQGLRQIMRGFRERRDRNSFWCYFPASPNPKHWMGALSPHYPHPSQFLLLTNTRIHHHLCFSCSF